MSVTGGEVIFRQWSEENGLQEVSETFDTLEALYQFCITAHDPLLVDRVNIDGSDNNGNHRRVTLVFQSITISEE